MRAQARQTPAWQRLTKEQANNQAYDAKRPSGHARSVAARRAEAARKRMQRVRARQKVQMQRGCDCGQDWCPTCLRRSK